MQQMVMMQAVSVSVWWKAAACGACFAVLSLLMPSSHISQLPLSDLEYQPQLTAE